MEKGIKWLFAALAVFAIGIIVGCSVGIKISPKLLYDYFSELSKGEIKPFTASALINASVWWAVLFLSAFFRFGTVTASLTAAARGFVDGFSVTAILRIFGIKGILMSFLGSFGAMCTVLMAGIVMRFLDGKGNNIGGFVLRSTILLAIALVTAILASLLSSVACKMLLGSMNF